MKLTNENWLSELGWDILSRGSFYPDSEPIKGLNSTNWLYRLGRDILDRGTLYPEYDDVGPIFDSNWLMKLRDDIVSRGTLYPEKQYVPAVLLHFSGLPADFTSVGSSNSKPFTFKTRISPENATYRKVIFSLEKYDNPVPGETSYEPEEIGSIDPDTGTFTPTGVYGYVSVVIKNNDPENPVGTSIRNRPSENGYHD